MIPYYILAIEDEDDRLFMENLYVEYERLLHHETNKIVKDFWDTQDIVQTVLVKIINSRIPLLKSLPERRRVNYLITACHNTAYNFLRKKNVEGSLVFNIDEKEALKEIPSDGPEIEELLILSEKMQNFSLVWEQLDEKTKYLLGARYILEESTKEISEELQISQACVRVALSRARKKVKELSEQHVEHC